MNILFVNACPRKQSRTKQLAKYLLAQLEGTLHERDLSSSALEPLSEAMLERRTALIEQQNFNHPLFQLAREFAAAEVVVIAAPFWDLSFCALLKIYIENINIVGITFAYQADGKPHGLCKAQKLYYVTTAGGPIVEDAYGYGYIQTLAKQFYGIPHTYCIKAENLDVEQADVVHSLEQAKRRIDDLLKAGE